MKNFYALIVALFLINGAMAQSDKPCLSCLPQGIHFRLQAQIDSFAINYPNCTEIEGYVLIGGTWEDTTNISNLNGLSVLTSIGGNLNIGAWDIPFPYNLTSLSGLNNVISIGGWLEISGSQNLTNLMGLEGINSIEGRLVIWANSILTTLTGINNINAGSIIDLYISENPSLSTCEIESICSYLASPNGTIAIENNNTGCNSQAEVEAACAAIGVKSMTPESPLTIYPNPTSISITIKTPITGIIAILNTSGQAILQQLITEPMTNIDVSGWQSGVYLVKVVGEKGVKVGKFIKH
jgi:hypothetical protein